MYGSTPSCATTRRRNAGGTSKRSFGTWTGPWWIGGYTSARPCGRPRPPERAEPVVTTAAESSPTYEVPALLSAFGAAPQPARVSVQTPTPGQRLTRAARALATFWAVAAGCVFLPVLHFVLVPTFAVIGLVMGAARLRDQQTVTPRPRG